MLWRYPLAQYELYQTSNVITSFIRWQRLYSFPSYKPSVGELPVLFLNSHYQARFPCFVLTVVTWQIRHKMLLDRRLPGQVRIGWHRQHLWRHCTDPTTIAIIMLDSTNNVVTSIPLNSHWTSPFHVFFRTFSTYTTVVEITYSYVSPL